MTAMSQNQSNANLFDRAYPGQRTQCRTCLREEGSQYRHEHPLKPRKVSTCLARSRSNDH